MRHRNFRVWEQIMQQRIKRILSRNERIRKGYLPRPASYFDLGEHFSTTTQATGQLTLQDVQRLITTLKDEVRAGEAQSYYETLYSRPYYQPEILHTSWKATGGMLK